MLLPVDLRKRRAVSNVLTAVMLVFVVLLSVGSDIYVSASVSPQQAPNVTTTTTTFTTTTSWTTSTIWSTVTSVIHGVWTTTQYITSTSTVTITADPYTKLLLHMDGTAGSKAFLDSSPQPYTITANGNAQIDTAQSKFGGASGLFDGMGDYLSIPDSADWYFAGNAFTIEGWFRFASVTGYQDLLTQYVSGTNFIEFWMYGGTSLGFAARVDGANIINHGVTVSLSINTWYHIALVRSGNNYYYFVNGIRQGAIQVDDSDMPNLAGNLTIGGIAGYNYLNGWIDEYRVSKGIARWTSNFTPPTAPY